MPRCLPFLLVALLLVACGGEESREQHVGREKRVEATSEIDAFWMLIDEVHAKTGFDFERKDEVLRARLDALSEDELVAFARVWRAKHEGAYDEKLWAAAYTIHGGCSDDGFDDFRGTVIMLGRTTYEAALRDPESLLEAAKAAGGNLRHENYRFTLRDAWEAKAGEDPMPGDGKGDPLLTGEDWEDDDLPTLLPRLFAEFGG